MSQELSSDRRVFGVPLHRLASDGKVPLVVDRLITTIEMHGLYTEGIYRKSGVRCMLFEINCCNDYWRLRMQSLKKLKDC